MNTIDNRLKTVAGLCFLVGSGTGFSGLIPAWAAVIISFVGVLAGALATSPAFAGAPENVWNRVLQVATAVFVAAAGSSQLAAVQNLISPAHPVLAAKVGLAVMLGAQICAYLAQKDPNVKPPAAVAFIPILIASAVMLHGCAHVDAIASDIKSCITSEDQALLKDAEQAFVSEAEGIFLCDPTLAPAALVVCAEDALPAACSVVGPDATRLESCIETKIENDPNVAAAAKSRAAKMKARAAHRHAMRAATGGAS